MLKYNLVPFVLVVGATLSKAFAFDPFTALSAAGSASSIFSSAKGISDTLGDVSQFSDFLGIASETLDESVGLASDLGYETDSKELDEQVDRMEDLNQKLKEIKWSSQDLKYTFDSDIGRAKSLSQKIRQMRKVVGISKKLAGAFGLKTKGSEKVATLQQVKINSMMLDELQAMRRLQLLAFLEEKEKEARQDIYLNKIIVQEEKKRRSFN